MAVRRDDLEVWETAAVREAAVKRLVALPASQRTRTAVAAEAERLGVSTATMFRLLAAWRAEPVRSTLLPARRGPKRGLMRAPENKRTIIKSAIEQFYSRREAPRMSDLLDEIAARCREVDLVPPVWATVKRYIATYDQRRLLHKREGRAAADEVFAITPGLVGVDRPLQRVQIDHTIADVFVVDDETRLPLGRPFLTLAIDIFTRMVVGFHLTMDHPSALSVGLCLTQAVFEKGEWLNSREIRHVWPCSGLPELLHLDNASEFHSRALARGCEEHGIKLEFRPRRTPHFGGHIERLIGTTMGALHLLPGTTKSSVSDKRDYDPERHAALTLRQLERWIALEIVGKYHNKVHSTLGRPPLAVWTEHAPAIDWRIPRDRTRFLLDFLPYEERTLQKTGVQLLGFEYASPQLRAYRVRRKTRLRVKYDPRDISRVWVEAVPGTFIEARWRQLGQPPMSKWERERALKALAARGRSERDARAIGRAVLEQRAIEDAGVTLTRQARLDRHKRLVVARQSAALHSPEKVLPPDIAVTPDELIDGPLPYFETEFLHGRRR
jgi:putative transposase